MHAIWVQAPHNLHCPRCDRRLVQQADVHGHGREEFVDVDDASTLTCPGGHRLPTPQELYDHRERRGYAPVAPVSQVPPPHG
ncbi:hypothetical protein [Blastococcus sp. SYSU D00820]